MTVKTTLKNIYTARTIQREKREVGPVHSAATLCAVYKYIVFLCHRWLADTQWSWLTLSFNIRHRKFDTLYRVKVAFWPSIGPTSQTHTSRSTSAGLMTPTGIQRVVCTVHFAFVALLSKKDCVTALFRVARNALYNRTRCCYSTAPFICW